MRVRERVCPSINIPPALLLCLLFSSILLFARVLAGTGKKQGRTRGGRGSAISSNARGRFSRGEYAENLSSEMEHLGIIETGARKRTVLAVAH